MKIIIAEKQEHFIDALEIRERVFCDEQKIPAAIEIDELDRDCLHVLLYENEKAKAVLRLVRFPDYFKIGRVAVLAKDRKKGYGKALMLGIEQLDIVKNKKRLCLDAQISAVGFYQSLGYTIIGEPFEEAGILHYHAQKEL